MHVQQRGPEPYYYTEIVPAIVMIVEIVLVVPKTNKVNKSQEITRREKEGIPHTKRFFPRT